VTFFIFRIYRQNITVTKIPVNKIIYTTLSQEIEVVLKSKRIGGGGVR